MRLLPLFFAVACAGDKLSEGPPPILPDWLLGGGDTGERRRR